MASYYGDWHHGKTTASGAPFDQFAMTAAHRSLPFGTIVRVARQNPPLRTCTVTINDRGPYIRGRIIDLSLEAARNLDMIREGVTPVILTIEALPSTNARVATR